MRNCILISICNLEINFSLFIIGVYIFSYGIGVDIDYDCGGNSSAELWTFENWTFEEAYDKMVDYVNGYKS